MACTRMVVITPTKPGEQAMDGSIRLSARERKVLLQEVRRGGDPERPTAGACARVAGGRLVLERDRRRVVHQHKHGQSLAETLLGRWRVGGAGVGSSSASPWAVVDQPGDSLGHSAIASGLWFLSQSLDLWHRGD